MEGHNQSPSALADELGERLKQARLNADLTQSEVADRAGVSRRAVLNAEKGKVQLEVLIAIMQSLGLSDNLDALLPNAPASPIQLAKLQGKQRQRASGKRNTPSHKKSQKKSHTPGESSTW